MSDQQSSDGDQTKRDIPSFIEPRPPLILNPFMRPRPQKGTNLIEFFEEDSESEEPEWVQVYLRLKPCNVKCNLYEVKSDRCLITSVDTAPMGHGRRTQHHVSKMYTFSHIFGPESNQKEIFEQVVKENLKKLPEGHNFTLLTYGASGSGKTYTLMGTVQSPGLVPRSLEYVFRVVEASQQPLYKPVDGETVKLGYYDQDSELQFVKKLRQVSAPLREKYRRMSAQFRNDITTSTLDLSNRTRYFVWVSFVEIYNEAIYDLLTNCDRSKATSKLRLREDSNGNVYVKGATQAFVRSSEEAYDVLVAGKHNLQTAATGVHANSSRSHCIFTITMLTDTESGVRASCVRLCDLAGCERQRHARNTGARMQESRAINSSLHVLERCLHMLRRKQKKIDATLVPYRESKLTRLLGAGLSGARGEAVSMVVTLNPAPQYAHETRHVLQLAAVARDIQVNQTIQESTWERSIESSAQETTMEPSVDLMRLREENDRLRFELVQAQHRNRELIESSQEQQKQLTKTMYEVVDEAKDITRQYYEAQMQSLKAEMEEMREEYENKLKELTTASESKRPSLQADTPSRSLQKKVAELMTEIAILEEKLSSEQLARARAEEEVQHLRACIDERDEITEEDELQKQEEVQSISDESDSEEDDVYNESLEPTFKKEDINRSIRRQQSILNGTKHILDDNESNIYNDTVHENRMNDSSDNEKNETLKVNDSHDYTVKETTSKDADDDDNINTHDNMTNCHNDTSDIHKELENNTKEMNKTKFASVRGTYVVRDDVNVTNEETQFAVPERPKILQSFENTKDSVQITKPVKDNFEKNVDPVSDEMSEITSETFASRILNKKSKTRDYPSDISLAQFEILEMEMKCKKSDGPPEVFANFKPLKVKRNFFDVDKEIDLIPKKDPQKSYFENIDTKSNFTDVQKFLDEERSPSIVKEDIINNFEPSTMKKLLGESFSRQSDRFSAVTIKSLAKKQVSVDIFESPQVFNAIEVPESVGKSLPASVQVEQKLSPELEGAHDETVSVSNFDSIKPNNAETCDIFIRPKEIEKSSAANESINKPKDNESIFDKCIEKKASFYPKEKDNSKVNISKSIENVSLNAQSDPKFTDIEIKLEHPSISTLETSVSATGAAGMLKDTSNVSGNQDHQVSYNNTIEYFDKIYKDITPRATEFELLISQNNSKLFESTVETEKDTEKTKYNLRHVKINTSAEHKDITDKSTEKRFRFIKKDRSVDKKNDISDNNNKTVDNDITANEKDLSVNNNSNRPDEALLESQAKYDSQTKPKRKLRLRRRRNDTDETADRQRLEKLKDIVNLQKEFCDVTMNLPVAHKEKKDIESPEKVGDENLPPVQSCPSKSVTRSRRKLFTPRAEPLEESPDQSEDGNERVRVPRPSYHRTRARRKL